MRLLVAAAAALALAGCHESREALSSTDAEPATLRDYLGTTPSRCGVTAEPRFDPDALQAAPTVRAQIDLAAREVSRVRGLRAPDDLDVEIVAKRRLEKLVAARARRELDKPELEAVRRALVLLGAIPPKFDLRRELLEEVTTNVGGFYDPETDEIYAGRLGEGRKLAPIDLEILVHELEHAVVDAALGLPELESMKGWGDDQLAWHSVFEGSATAVEFRYLRSVLGAELFAVAVDDSNFVSLMTGALDLPPYLARAVTFPYVEGLGFVCALYASGGWERVNEAVKRRPPTATAEILFPERYLAREQPRDPPDPGELPPPWRENPDASGRFGAFDLYALFAIEELDRPLARARAWGGGEIEIWTRGGDAAIGVALVEHPDEAGLCASVRRWERTAVPKGNVVEIECAAKRVRFAIAPSRALASSLVQPGR